MSSRGTEALTSLTLVEIRQLLTGVVEECHDELRQIAQELPLLEDGEGKLRLLRHLHATRQRAQRLGAIVAWSAKARAVAECRSVLAAAAGHSAALRDAADRLAMLHGELVATATPVYDIPSASHLASGAGYRLLPSAIEDVVTERAWAAGPPRMELAAGSRAELSGAAGSGSEPSGVADGASSPAPGSPRAARATGATAARTREAELQRSRRAAAARALEYALRRKLGEEARCVHGLQVVGVAGGKARVRCDRGYYSAVLGLVPAPGPDVTLAKYGANETGGETGGAGGGAVEPARPGEGGSGLHPPVPSTALSVAPGGGDALVPGGPHGSDAPAPAPPPPGHLEGEPVIEPHPEPGPPTGGPGSETRGAALPETSTVDGAAPSRAAPAAASQASLASPRLWRWRLESFALLPGRLDEAGRLSDAQREALQRALEHRMWISADIVELTRAGRQDLFTLPVAREDAGGASVAAAGASAAGAVSALDASSGAALGSASRVEGGAGGSSAEARAGREVAEEGSGEASGRAGRRSGPGADSHPGPAAAGAALASGPLPFLHAALTRIAGRTLLYGTMLADAREAQEASGGTPPAGRGTAPLAGGRPAAAKVADGPAPTAAAAAAAAARPTPPSLRVEKAREGTGIDVLLWAAPRREGEPGGRLRLTLADDGTVRSRLVPRAGDAGRSAAAGAAGPPAPGTDARARPDSGGPPPGPSTPAPEPPARGEAPPAPAPTPAGGPAARDPWEAAPVPLDPSSATLASLVRHARRRLCLRRLARLARELAPALPPGATSCVDARTARLLVLVSGEARLAVSADEATGLLRFVALSAAGTWGGAGAASAPPAATDDPDGHLPPGAAEVERGRKALRSAPRGEGDADAVARAVGPVAAAASALAAASVVAELEAAARAAGAGGLGGPGGPAPAARWGAPLPPQILARHREAEERAVGRARARGARATPPPWGLASCSLGVPGIARAPPGSRCSGCVLAHVVITSSADPDSARLLLAFSACGEDGAPRRVLGASPVPPSVLFGCAAEVTRSGGGRAREPEGGVGERAGKGLKRARGSDGKRRAEDDEAGPVSEGAAAGEPDAEAPRAAPPSPKAANGSALLRLPAAAWPRVAAWAAGKAVWEQLRRQVGAAGMRAVETWAWRGGRLSRRIELDPPPGLVGLDAAATARARDPRARGGEPLPTRVYVELVPGPGGDAASSPPALPTGEWDLKLEGPHFASLAAAERVALAAPGAGTHASAASFTRRGLSLRYDLSRGQSACEAAADALAIVRAQISRGRVLAALEAAAVVPQGAPSAPGWRVPGCGTARLLAEGSLAALEFLVESEGGPGGARGDGLPSAVKGELDGPLAAIKGEPAGPPPVVKGEPHPATEGEPAGATLAIEGGRAGTPWDPAPPPPANGGSVRVTVAWKASGRASASSSSRPPLPRVEVSSSPTLPRSVAEGLEAALETGLEGPFLEALAVAVPAAASLRAAIEPEKLLQAGFGPTGVLEEGAWRGPGAVERGRAGVGAAEPPGSKAAGAKSGAPARPPDAARPHPPPSPFTTCLSLAARGRAYRLEVRYSSPGLVHLRLRCGHQPPASLEALLGRRALGAGGAPLEPSRAAADPRLPATLSAWVRAADLSGMLSELFAEVGRGDATS